MRGYKRLAAARHSAARCAFSEPPRERADRVGLASPGRRPVAGWRRRAPVDRPAARARPRSRARAPARSARPSWRRWRVPRPCIRRAWSASQRTRHRRLACRAARPGCRRRQRYAGISACGTMPGQAHAIGRLDQRAQRTVADEQKARPRAGFEHVLDRRGQGWDAVPDAKRAREADHHGCLEPEPPTKLRGISRGLELLGIDAVRVDQDPVIGHAARRGDLGAAARTRRPRGPPPAD